MMLRTYDEADADPDGDREEDGNVDEYTDEDVGEYTDWDVGDLETGADTDDAEADDAEGDNWEYEGAADDIGDAGCAEDVGAGV